MFRNAILPEADLYLNPPLPNIRYNISTGEYNDGTLQSMAASPGSPRDGGAYKQYQRPGHHCY